MRMRRFFVKSDQIGTDEITILGDDVKHLRVLRLAPGDEVVLSDGQGKDYTCRLVEVGPEQATAKVVEAAVCEAEPTVAITLYQGLPKSDKMDLIVQKCTEIGVSRFVPVATERAIVELKGSKAAKRIARWARIAEEAAKQSRRGRIPQIEPVMSWQEALADAAEQRKRAGDDHFLAVVPYELEQTVSVRQVLVPHRQLGVGQAAIFIGPEGGLTSAEVDAAAALGCRPISLGARILRTETAGLVTAALLLYELDAANL